MIHGTLDGLHLGDFLQWLKMGGMTGRLSLSGDGYERRIDFMEGRIIFLSSTVPSERLASFMAAEKVLPLDRLRSCLAHSLFQHRPLTRILLEETDLGTEKLRSIMESLAMVIATRLLLSPPRELTFDPEFPVRDLLGQDLDLDPTRLLLDAARRTDESPEAEILAITNDLPVSGEAFDNFFWELVGPSFTRQNPVSGEELLRLRHLIHGVVGTLSQWATTSFGLVPVPADHVRRILRAMERHDVFEAEGFPQAVWNQTVVASGIRVPGSEDLSIPGDLLCDASFHDLCDQLGSADLWHRPDVPRLDELTSRTAVRWSRLAAAAAPHLGTSPGEVRRAAHLLVVPTDLVLWVLTTVPIPHASLRHTLLQELPRRLGAILAMRAALPVDLQRLFQPGMPTAAGACLHLAHRWLPNAGVWLDPLAGDDAFLLTTAPPDRLAAAADAVASVSLDDLPGRQEDRVG